MTSKKYPEPPTDAPEPSPDAQTASGLGASARNGDTDAARKLGSMGGKKSQAIQAARRAGIAAAVALSTVDERRNELSKAVAELQASDQIDSARKVTALATAIKLLNDMDGFTAMAEELTRLRAAMANAQALTSQQTWTCTVPAPMPLPMRDTPPADMPRPSAGKLVDDTTN